VAAAAGLDVGLRTLGAGAVAAAMLPSLLRGPELRRTLATLDLYRELASHHDATRTFLPPQGVPNVELVRREAAMTRWLPGTVDLLRFGSTYVPRNPAARAAYSRVARNSTSWAQHWRHDDGPRPTVVVVHGFMASPYWFNKMFFSLPWWYANGYDLLLVTLPFHGRRARPGQYSGAGLFGGGPSRLIEALLHAVHDLRSWIDHLELSGVHQVGMTGLSLGGYLTSVMAAVDERLHFAIPNAPVTDLSDLTNSWAPMGPMVQTMLQREGVSMEDFSGAMAVHSPLNYPAKLDRDRLFIIAGLGDRLAPPEHAERLWEHWDRPRIHAFPGNHVLHVQRGAYLRRVGRFIRGTGFGV
jgi:pimeloyl-ACP methyl ester carboxylesterase